jgi:hypothetical protein
MINQSPELRMAQNKDDFSDPTAFRHGPLPAKRVPRSQYSERFLETIKPKLHPVPADWNHDRTALPPDTLWVIYPNGDIEPLGLT